MKYNKLYIVEDKRSDQAKKRCLEVIRLHFNNVSWLDRVFEHQDNPEGLTYLMYMFKQFMETFYHNPSYRSSSVMRLAPLFCRLAFEANFQNNNPDSDKLSRLEQMLFYIYNLSSNGKLDVSKISLDATYDDMETTFGEAIDELDRQEEERMNSTEYEKNSAYKMLGPLSFEEAKYYGDKSCPNSLLCYTQNENIWNQYTNNGNNKCYVFLKDGWETLDVIHDEYEGGAYDTYGLSMIFVFVKGSKLVYCNTRWNHQAEYAKGCSCDHALTKEMLSEVLGINFNELFGVNTEKLNATINEKLRNGVEYADIFNETNYAGNDFFIVKLNGEGYNVINNKNVLISNVWYDKITTFTDTLFKVYDSDQGMNIMSREGNILSERWFFSIYGKTSDYFIVEDLDEGYNYIDKNGRLLSKEWFSDASSFDNNFAIVFKSGFGCNLINKNFQLVFDEWFYEIDKNGDKHYVIVRKDGKCNMFNNILGTFISDIWFDGVRSFSDEGYAMVRLIDKGYNYINKEGKLLLDKFYYDAYDFENGYGIVAIEDENGNEKCNYVDVNGNFISNNWFDNALEFSDGYAKVFIEGKGYNYINTEGEILSKDWFSYCGKFTNGYSTICIDDKGYNFINTEGEILSKYWFDDISFSDDFKYHIKLNGKRGIFNLKDRKLYHIEINDSKLPKKQLIKLTEDDFYNIIKESVKNIINKMIV